MSTITANTGSGNWNVGATWAGGVQPTAADDVVIPAAANVTIPASTTAVCRSVTVSAVGVLAFAATTSALTIGDGTAGAGNVAVSLNAASTLTLTGIGTINFVSTSGTQQTVTSGGKTLPNMTFNGAGSSYLLSDGLTSSGVLSFLEGTLNTGGQTVVAVRLTSSSGSTRTLTLGSSAITLSEAGGTAAALSVANSGLTVTTNTAVLTITGAAAVLLINSADLNLNGASIAMTGSGAAATNSSGLTFGLTVANFTRTGTAVKTDSLSVVGDLTCTGNLNLGGNSSINRLLVFSPVRGSSRTITVAGTNTLTNVDFMDITAAGAGGTWSGTSLGNCLGNSNITFTGAVTRFAVVAGNVSATAMWSATSGGADGASVPLPQDTVNFDAGSAAGTYTNDMPRFAASITFTGFTRTFTASIAWETYGSITYAAGMTLTGTSTMTLAGRGSHTITTNTKTVTYATIVNGPGGTYSIVGTYTTSSTAAMVLVAGTLDDGGNAVSMTSSAGFAMSGGTLNASGTWTFSRTSVGNIWAVTGGVVNASTATIVLGAASANLRTFVGGGNTYGTLTYTVAASTGILNITGVNTFAAINVSGGSRTLRFDANQSLTSAAGWQVFGTAGNLVTLSSNAGARTLTITSGVVSSDYLTISNSTATGGAAFYAGANSTNGGGNTGWWFNEPQPHSGTVTFQDPAYI